MNINIIGGIKWIGIKWKGNRKTNMTETKK